MCKNRQFVNKSILYFILLSLPLFFNGECNQQQIPITVATEKDVYFTVDADKSKIDHIGGSVKYTFKGKFTSDYASIYLTVQGTRYGVTCKAYDLYSLGQITSGYDSYFTMNTGEFPGTCNEEDISYQIKFRATYNGGSNWREHALLLDVGNPCSGGWPEKIKTYQHDYMEDENVNYSFRFENTGQNGYYYKLTNAFSGCKVTINEPTENSINYEVIDAENDLNKLILKLKTFTNIHFTEAQNYYICSMDYIMNCPVSVDPLGITIQTTNLNNMTIYPSFILTGQIRLNNNYKLIDEIRVATHELGHQIRVWEHGNHSSDENCCIMKSQVLTSGCSDRYHINFCSYHKCLINKGR